MIRATEVKQVSRDGKGRREACPLPSLGFALKPIATLNYRIRAKRLNFPATILKDGPNNYPDDILTMDR